MRRRFNKGQKIELYLTAGGKCQNCGVELQHGWHADHKRPWKAGGETELINGQALCPDCNLKKGAKELEGGKIKLRIFQERFLQTFINNLEKGTKILIANVHPGSGKSLAIIHSANYAWKEGFADGFVVFNPRLNLCRQLEESWDGKKDKEGKLIKPGLKTLYPDPKMGGIRHRENQEPILWEGDTGYTTTYASLASKFAIHERFLTEHRNIVIYLDEAQTLGVPLSKKDRLESKKQSEYVLELASHPNVRMVILLTGTPYRSDNQPLVLAQNHYLANGKLKADVESDYQDGLIQRYLREVEFKLMDGKGKYKYLDQTEDFTISASETNTHLSAALRTEECWKRLVDMTIENHLEQQAVWSGFRSLIAALDQDMAQEIFTYISRRYPSLKTTIAVSDDGPKALYALETFKDGHFDILITVRMAYIGYDYPAINTICVLTNYRHIGFLDQLIARGLRVCSDVPYELQTCYIVATDDPGMTSYSDYKNSGMIEGIKSRQDLERLQRGFGSGDDGPIPDAPEREKGYVVDFEVTDITAQGLNPETKVPARAYDFLNLHKSKNQTVLASMPINKLHEIFSTLDPDYFMGGHIAAKAKTTIHKEGNHFVSSKDEAGTIRSEISSVCSSLNTHMQTYLSAEMLLQVGWFKGYCQNEVKKQFGNKGQSEVRDIAELKERLKWANTVLRTRINQLVKDYGKR
jgi:superfamily II DNA or RNA helicase